MLQALLGPISSLAGTWLEGKVETKKAEAASKVAKAKAETDEYGKTHSVQVNTFVPEPQTKEEVSVDDSPLDF